MGYLGYDAENEQFPCVLSIDPGTTVLGAAVIYFDPHSGDITKTLATAFTSSRLYSVEDWRSGVFGERDKKIRVLKKCITKMLYEHTPVMVVMESPFFNPTRPMAFEALVDINNTVREAVFEYNPHIQIVRIPPSSVKNAVGAKGNAKKEEVRDKVLLLENLHYEGKTPLADLPFDALDAVAVGYSVIKPLHKNFRFT